MYCIHQQWPHTSVVIWLHKVRHPTTKKPNNSASKQISFIICCISPNSFPFITFTFQCEQFQIKMSFKIQFDRTDFQSDEGLLVCCFTCLQTSVQSVSTDSLNSVSKNHTVVYLTGRTRCTVSTTSGIKFRKSNQTMIHNSVIISIIVGLYLTHLVLAVRYHLLHISNWQNSPLLLDHSVLMGLVAVTWWGFFPKV